MKIKSTAIATEQGTAGKRNFNDESLLRLGRAGVQYSLSDWYFRGNPCSCWMWIGIVVGSWSWCQLYGQIGNIIKGQSMKCSQMLFLLGVWKCKGRGSVVKDPWKTDATSHADTFIRVVWKPGRCSGPNPSAHIGLFCRERVRVLKVESLE